MPLVCLPGGLVTSQRAFNATMLERTGRLRDASARVSYQDLCEACLRLGLTSCGGPAMVGYVGEVMVERRRWISREEFAEGLTLCQLVPGATHTAQSSEKCPNQIGEHLTSVQFQIDISPRT